MVRSRFSLFGSLSLSLSGSLSLSLSLSLCYTHTHTLSLALSLLNPREIVACYPPPALYQPFCAYQLGEPGRFCALKLTNLYCVPSL